MTSGSISRRGFLGTSGAAASMALAPSGLRSALRAGVSASRRRAEVVVFGSGLAGLVAARSLVRRGVEVVVLDTAPERRAGRRAARRERAASSTAVLASHERTLALADELGVEVASDPGADGSHGTDGSGGGSLAEGGAVAREVGGALELLNLMAARVDPEHPGAAPGAAARDATTLAAWADERVGTDTGREAFDEIVRAVWGVAPPELSLLHVLAGVAAERGIGPLVNLAHTPSWRGPRLVERPAAAEHGGRSCRSCRDTAPRTPWAAVPAGREAPTSRVALVGGPEALVDRLTGELGSLVRPVGSTVQVGRASGGGVTVRTGGTGDTTGNGGDTGGDAVEVTAERLVVAAPPEELAAVAVDAELGAPAGAGGVGHRGGDAQPAETAGIGPLAAPPGFWTGEADREAESTDPISWGIARTAAPAAAWIEAAVRAGEAYAANHGRTGAQATAAAAEVLR